MIDPTYVAFAYAVIGIAALVSVVAIAAIVVAARELLGGTPVVGERRRPVRALLQPGRVTAATRATPARSSLPQSPSPATGGEGLLACPANFHPFGW